MGRGIKGCSLTKSKSVTNRPTNRPTDTVTYRVACTRLKREQKLAFHSLMIFSHFSFFYHHRFSFYVHTSPPSSVSFCSLSPSLSACLSVYLSLSVCLSLSLSLTLHPFLWPIHVLYHVKSIIFHYKNICNILFLFVYLLICFYCFFLCVCWSIFFFLFTTADV